MKSVTWPQDHCIEMVEQPSFEQIFEAASQTSPNINYMYAI